jgi:predicted GTPase
MSDPLKCKQSIFVVVHRTNSQLQKNTMTTEIQRYNAFMVGTGGVGKSSITVCTFYHHNQLIYIYLLVNSNNS